MRTRMILMALALSLAACSSTGHRFEASGLVPLVPGQATYAEVVNALGGPPTQIYRQADGSYTARWSHKTSFVNDGLYGTQSVSLAFGADHRLQRSVDSSNILLDTWARTRLLGLTPPHQTGQYSGVASGPVQIIQTTTPAHVPPVGAPDAASVAPR